MRAQRPSARHAFLCAFVLACGMAAALGLRSAASGLLALVAVLALPFEIALPPRVQAAAVWSARIAAAVVAMAGVVFTLYPVVPDSVVFGISMLGGHALVLLAGLLLLARAPAGGATVPAALGALVVACLPPEPAGLRLALAVAGAALVSWMVATPPRGARDVELRPVALAVFVTLAVAGAVGIALVLPWAQPQVELAVARMISNDHEAQTGMSTESRLGDVQRLARSKRVALRYYAEAARDLRVRAFTRFDGRAWHALPGEVRPLPPLAGSFPVLDGVPGSVLGAEGGVFPARIVIRSPVVGAMPAPAHTRAVRADTEVGQDAAGVLLPKGAPAIYAVLSAADGSGDVAALPAHLEVPEKTDPRLRTLAHELTAGLPLPQRVARVLAHFQSGYRYSLEVGAFRTADPVAEFVFEKKQGYCEYFASATTLLLRLSGVPARYVTGHAVKPFQRAGDHYVVRDSDAHAWSEAWLPGQGWVEVDATPAGDYEALHGDVETGLLDRLMARWDEITAHWNQGGAAGLARAAADAARRHPVTSAALLAALAAWQVAKRWKRKARTSRATPAVAPPLPSHLHVLLAEVDALCAARGFPRPGSRPPREHVSRPELPLADEERARCLQKVDTIYAELYGGASAAERQER
jgi:transglutaminase-like putative cysteine protease